LIFNNTANVAHKITGITVKGEGYFVCGGCNGNGPAVPFNSTLISTTPKLPYIINGSSTANLTLNIKSKGPTKSTYDGLFNITINTN
jgi:hypothetical protein